MSGGSQGQGGMGSTQSSVPNTINQGGYMANINPAYAGSPAQQQPQWMKGLQLGTQLAGQGLGMAQAGQRPPMQAPMLQRPMMGAGGMPGGMPQQGVVPGSVPQMPMGGGPMASGGMGMQGQQGGPQINPQLMQMLMRGRQM